MQAPSIHTSELLRDVIAADFRTTLPIRGGWGYGPEDAVVIDKNDPVAASVPFDGVGIEYFIAEKRTYEELIVFRPEGDRFSGITWELVYQRLVCEGAKTFDHLRVRVTALRDADWQRLKAEWEGLHGYGSPGFDEAAHNAERERCTLQYETDFWFEISSFCGSSA